ncbi:NAD(P)/FAD-dependent oxidoreductase [Sporichthya brevicatena]
MVEGLAELLKAADRRTLAAVVTHLSGDPEAIRDLRDRPAIEATAAQVLPPFMLGMASPAAPDDELLQAAMDLAVGAPIPPEYRDYAREQTGIGPVPPLAPIRAPEDFRVLVIGAGASGIMVARTLDNRGLTNFRIAEANASPGGAWWKNTYPGCRVDTPSLLYSYSFDQDPGWPEHFSPQPALLQYLRGVVDDSGLTDRLDVDTRVTSLRWNETEAVWHVEAAHGDGSTSSSTANVVIAAPGLLSVPKLPDIPGRASFAGPAFHSAEWDHSVDLTGKRVAVIGTGASAQQIVPAIAPIAGEVVVHQRSPQWLMPHEKYGRKLTGLERDLYDRIPMYREWNRFAESWRFGDGTTPLVTVDPEWDDPRSISAANDRLRDELEKYIRREVGTRPDLLEKVMPSYPPFTKRMLIDNGWYQALLRDNVRLNTAAVIEMTPDGVRTTDGFDEVDVIVFATGFHADRFLSPMQVTGVGGVDVTAELDRDPQAYLGLALPDCPNFFLTPGPNAYLGHAGNGMFFAECHARYISECLRLMLESGSREIVVRPEAVRRYALETRSRLDSSVWNNPEVDSWFKGERKHIVTVAAGSVLDFWNSYRRVDVSAYDFAPRG